MSDKIVKQITLDAPVPRVWRALTNHREFGTWFRVALDGPFIVGEVSRGQMTYPGHEGTAWRAMVIAMDPAHRFAFTWRPDDTDDSADDDPTAPEILVEFVVEAIPEGTRLTITESGFEALPHDARVDMMRRNTEGWDIQAKSIAAYVEI